MHMIQRREEKLNLQTSSGVTARLQMHETWIRLDKQILLHWQRKQYPRRGERKTNNLSTTSYYTEFLSGHYNLFKLIQWCQWRHKSSKLSKIFTYSSVISNEVTTETYWIISRCVLRQCDVYIYKSSGACTSLRPSFCVGIAEHGKQNIRITGI